MTGFRITITIEEYIDESFRSIEGAVRACADEDLLMTFNKLAAGVRKFLKTIEVQQNGQ